MGNGLALLSLPKALPDSHWPELKDLVSANAKPDEPVTAYGYPSFSEELFSAPGKIENLTLPFTFFPIQSQLISVIAEDGEFGMSGGFAVLAKGSFLGVLSHQRLEGNENHLLLIPAATVTDWLARYFTNPQGYRAYFYRDAEGQKMAE